MRTPLASLCALVLTLAACGGESPVTAPIADAAPEIGADVMADVLVHVDGSADVPHMDASPEAAADASQVDGPACPPRANSSFTLGDGGCAYTCVRGYGDCDGNAANGCEVIVLGISAENCGACARRCVGGANATASCRAGLCGLTCEDGFDDCDGNAANGCEASLRSNTSCGMCGRVCPAGYTCQSGACVNTTAPGCPASCRTNADCATCSGAGPWCCAGGTCYVTTPRCP